MGSWACARWGFSIAETWVWVLAAGIMRWVIWAWTKTLEILSTKKVLTQKHGVWKSKTKQNKTFNQNLSGNEADFFFPRWLPLEWFFSEYEVIFPQILPVTLLGWCPQLGSKHVGLLPSSLGVVCIKKSGVCYELCAVPGMHTINFLSHASTFSPYKLFRDQFNGPPVQYNWALNWT